MAMTKSVSTFVVIGVLAAASAAPRTAFAQRGAGDPVRADMPLDTKHPPSMAEVRIPSHGAGMNGFVYLPGGTAKRGVVLMLHGYPGNERNLDIAQAVRRAGYVVVFFDYRGSWGSGGTFSFANARDDVASAIAWVRSPAIASKYNIDTRRVALIGHSMGGWLALEAAARDQNVGCVAGLASWNLGYGAGMMRKDPAILASTSSYNVGVTGADGPLRAKGADLDRELLDHETDYNYLRLAPALKNRSMLLAAATHDSPDENPAMHAELEHALRNAGATHVQNVTFDDDHPFSAHRIALTDVIIHWLANDCAAVWKGM
jgi:pimeloyl-ACP methyl ester carboxylesterase